MLSQKNTDLNSQLQQVTKERDELKEVLLVSKQPAEVKVIQERYQQEINVLEKRVCITMYGQPSCLGIVINTTKVIGSRCVLLL